jgi:guanylate kinase
MSGLLFIVSAPSGAGKTSLIAQLLTKVADLAVAISHTTRTPRPNEIDGQHYYFVSAQEFHALEQQKSFLETAKVFDHHYGTSAHEVDRLFHLGKDVILEIDCQGAKQIFASHDTQSIFILPPSLDTLKQRLHTRGTDQSIDTRLAQAQEEIAQHSTYNHIVINDNFDTALTDLIHIIRTARLANNSKNLQATQLLEQLLANKIKC